MRIDRDLMALLRATRRASKSPDDAIREIMKRLAERGSAARNDGAQPNEPA